MQIIANGFFENEYVKKSGGQSLFVSSEYDEGCEFVKKLLDTKIIKENDFAFKATGLLDNLNELITNA